MKSFSVGTILTLYLTLEYCKGFVPNSVHRSAFIGRSNVLTPSTLGLGGDLFENFKNLWEEWNGGGNQQSGGSSSGAADADGMTLIVTIPAKTIKKGGLRLFLMFYLMGQQNTPEKKTWQAYQSSAEEYVVNMYFKDSTAMLTIELTEHKITIKRSGSLPSPSYLIQESVLIEGILDELEKCANEANVAVEDRLLVPEPADAIALARGSVSFG